MILIFGGAYQGQLEYAKKRFSLNDGDIYMCGDAPELDFSCAAIMQLEHFTRACEVSGISSVDYIRQNSARLADKIIVSDDYSGGIVPQDEFDRAWRENHSRTLVALAALSDEAVRVFCGLPERVK